ncbi:MAG TPA: pilus assembly protein TadG-related protein [Limnochordia bacterium]|nr:pilus assembly protein TadG-related protein [Limnochordia bacterium]
MRQWLRREEGSIIPLIALSLTVIMGFAALTVDMGAMYLERERAQHSADAAALAAVQELPDTPDLARSVAYDYAERNGFDAADVQVDLSNGDSRVKVTITHRVQLFFARILGIATGTVAASATAQEGGVSSYLGIAPFGVQEQPFIYGAQYQLKAGPQSTEPPPYEGNFGPLALAANGAPSYEDTIKFG